VSTRAAYKIQKKTGALTELKEYPDRSHYTFAQDGWEEVADYSLDWPCATRGPNPPRQAPAPSSSGGGVPAALEAAEDSSQ
jgi:hypothetical protein